MGGNNPAEKHTPALARPKSTCDVVKNANARTGCTIRRDGEPLPLHGHAVLLRHTVV